MDDEDRDAILARRNRMMALALAGLTSLAGCDDPGPVETPRHQVGPCLSVMPALPESGEAREATEPLPEPPPATLEPPPEQDPEPRPRSCLSVRRPPPAEAEPHACLSIDTFRRE